MRLKGVIPPVITPLNTERQLDFAALARLCDAVITAGASGIFVLGSSGEGPWLTPREQQAVIGAAVGAAAKRVPVLAGILEPSTPRSLEALQWAQDAGADLVVATTPYYFVAEDAVQLRHFEAIIQASKVPVMLYNIPQMTHNPLRPATVRTLLTSSSVAGIKDSAGDLPTFLSFLELKTLHPDFAVFQGAERQAAAALRAGADGLVPGLGNLVPELFVAMLREAGSDNHQESERIQAQINQLWTLHQQGYFLECLKYALSLLGFGAGTTRAHGNLDAAAKEVIDKIVHAFSARAGVATSPNG